MVLVRHSAGCRDTGWPIPRYRIFRGAIVHSLASNRLELLPYALLGVRADGSIAFLRRYDRFNAELETTSALSEPCFAQALVHQIPQGHFLLPGLVDTHMHAPQWQNLGLGMDNTLREWLEKYTDPAEASFADSQKARQVYEKVVRTTLKLGSTTVAYNATIHVAATNILSQMCSDIGQRAIVGKICVTTGSTGANVESSIETSLDGSQKCIDFAQKLDGSLIQSSVMPRGGPYCPPKLMAGLGRQAQQQDLHVQLHMCETKSDIERTLELHPQTSYSAVYRDNGLLSAKTIVAHCIHLQPEDIQNLTESRAGVAHCPNSNTCLRDGVCKVRDLLDAGIKVGLGTDCSAGYMPSVHEAMRSASNVSRHLAMTTEDPRYVLGFNEIVFLATLGGAQALDMGDTIGSFEPGKQFDALLIDARDIPSMPDAALDEQTLGDMVKKWVFLGDDRSIKQVWVDGKLVGGTDHNT